MLRITPLLYSVPGYNLPPTQPNRPAPLYKNHYMSSMSSTPRTFILFRWFKPSIHPRGAKEKGTPNWVTNLLWRNKVIEEVELFLDIQVCVYRRLITTSLKRYGREILEYNHDRISHVWKPYLQLVVRLRWISMDTCISAALPALTNKKPLHAYFHDSRFTIHDIIHTP